MYDLQNIIETGRMRCGDNGSTLSVHDDLKKIVKNFVGDVIGAGPHSFKNCLKKFLSLLPREHENAIREHPATFFYQSYLTEKDNICAQS